jgi:magnesium-transporting ATPase (P-type)
VGALEEGGIGGQLALTGVEFAALAAPDQASAVARLAIFARVEPAHKSALIDRLREQVRAWGA